MLLSHRAAPSFIATASLLLGLLAPACQRAPERSVEGAPRPASSLSTHDTSVPAASPPAAPEPAPVTPEPAAADAMLEGEEASALGAANVAPSTTSTSGGAGLVP